MATSLAMKGDPSSLDLSTNPKAPPDKLFRLKAEFMKT
jgi:hypothetical protein